MAQGSRGPAARSRLPGGVRTVVGLGFGPRRDRVGIPDLRVVRTRSAVSLADLAKDLPEILDALRDHRWRPCSSPIGLVGPPRGSRFRRTMIELAGARGALFQVCRGI